VLLVPAPAIDPATLTVARADEGWRVTRLNITNRATDNLAELTRSNLWGGQFQTDGEVDERAKRWRVAGVAGQARDRVVLVQFGDDRILPLKVGEKFPDGTPIVDIKDNGVCVNIEGKKRLLPLADSDCMVMMKTKLMRTRSAHAVMLALGLGIGLQLGGCATEPVIPAKLDLPPRAPSLFDIAPSAVTASVATNSAKSGGTAIIADNPKPPLLPNKPAQAAATVVTSGQSADVTLNFDSLPLPAFIQTVYATVLKRNISIDPAVMARKDLVTLRSGKALTAGEAENSARLLLKSYGIAVQDIGGLIRIVPDSINTGYLPEIRRGRALPDTPLPLRPVFQLVELQAVRNTEIISYIKTLFGEKIRVTEDPIRNSLLLAGNGDDVQAALEAIQMLDQPLFKGRNSIRITPLIWSAEELVKRLTEILTQEGYAVGTTTPGSVQYPITLLPVAGINSVIVQRDHQPYRGMGADAG